MKIQGKLTIVAAFCFVLLVLLSGCTSWKEHVGPADIVATGSRVGSSVELMFTNLGAGEGRIDDGWVHAYKIGVPEDERVGMEVYYAEVNAFTLSPGESVLVTVFENHPSIASFDYVVIGLKWFNHEVGRFRGPLWQHRQIRINL